MRIAYVCADAGVPVFGDKGASVHVQEMVRAFQRIGHEVRVLCARRGAGAAPFPIEELGVGATAPGDREGKERARMATAAALEARLVALHRDWPFDLIYERYSLWSAAGVRAARRLGVPAVVEVNAPLVAEQAAFRELALADEARRIEAEVFSGASALTVVSDELVPYATARGAHRSRVHVAGNAVDTRAFSPEVAPAADLGLPAGAFVVGFAGSLKPWHGVEALLPAFRSLKAALPAAHLLVVGDGPRRDWVQGFAAGAGLEEAVTLTGWVPHDRLPAVIARMDVATVPYLAAEEHYFSPLKLYEYLAVGRPVVASRIGQTAAVLDGTGAALLVAPGDAGALAEALLAVARTPGLAERLSRAAAAIGRRHDWTDNARRAVALAVAWEAA